MKQISSAINDVQKECNGLRRCDIESYAVEVLRDQPAERCAAMRNILKQIKKEPQNYIYAINQ